MRMRFKRVYVASPYSHTNQAVMDKRFEEVTEIAAKLFVKCAKQNYVFLLPITQGHLLAKIGNIESDFKRWETQSLGMLAACQELWVVKLDGWKKSKGVRAEINFAKSSFIPVKYIDPKKYLNTA